MAFGWITRWTFSISMTFGLSNKNSVLSLESKEYLILMPLYDTYITDTIPINQCETKNHTQLYETITAYTSKIM